MSAQTEMEKEYIVEMEIGGTPVTMVPYVRNVIKNVVLGMVIPLRGYIPGAEIKIVIKQEK